MMAMLDLIDDGGELAAPPAMQTGAEDRGNLVGGEPPQAEFAAALEQLVDGQVALEDEVAAVLDLRDGIEARQVDLLSLLGGELRPQQEGPVVEPFADDWRTQSVGSGLQRSDIVDRQECIVVLAEADLCAVETPPRTRPSVRPFALVLMPRRSRSSIRAAIEPSARYRVKIMRTASASSGTMTSFLS